MLDEIALLMAGLIILLWRDPWRFAAYVAMALFWCVGACVQDIFNDNSIAVFNVVFGVVLLLFLSLISCQSRTAWPFFAMVFMTFIITVSMVYLIFEGALLPKHIRAYQDSIYMFFFLSLVSVCSPNLKGLYVRSEPSNTREGRF